MTRTCLISAVMLVALWFTPQAATGQKDKNTPQSRTLLGIVTNNGEQPLEKAIVYLKNTRCLVVQTFITGADGKFRFNSLSPTTDYEVFAQYSGKKSNTRALSAFDTRTEPYMPLKIDVPLPEPGKK